jgi:hypothetical protein
MWPTYLGHDVQNDAGNDIFSSNTSTLLLATHGECSNVSYRTLDSPPNHQPRPVWDMQTISKWVDKILMLISWLAPVEILNDMGRTAPVGNGKLHFANNTARQKSMQFLSASYTQLFLIDFVLLITNLYLDFSQYVRR